MFREKSWFFMKNRWIFHQCRFHSFWSQLLWSIANTSSWICPTEKYFVNVVISRSEWKDRKTRQNNWGTWKRGRWVKKTWGSPSASKKVRKREEIHLPYCVQEWYFFCCFSICFIWLYYFSGLVIMSSSMARFSNDLNKPNVYLANIIIGRSVLFCKISDENLGKYQKYFGKIYSMSHRFWA